MDHQLSKEVEELFKAVSMLENVSETRKFLSDLLTGKELNEFAMRWKVARMLNERVTYAEIEKNTGMSSTTIARIHKWLKEGKGGYRLMIDRINK